MKKCVIFDLDGTLIDSQSGIFESVDYALQKMGVEVAEEDRIKFIGPPLVMGFHQVAGLSLEKAEEAVAYYREYYITKGQFKVRLYEGADVLIKRLHEDGVQIALATHKLQRFAESILDFLGLRDYFHTIVGEVEGHSLEKEDMILKIMEALSISQKPDILFVGDSVFDGEGAQKVGVDFAAMVYGFGFKKGEEIPYKTVAVCESISCLERAIYGGQ